eukprot:jgi/Botrbrau1/2573/Bobra.145_1s0001.1
MELPGEGGAGYAHVSNAADSHVDKLEKLYRPGQVVPARVIGSRPIDGLATLTLKRSEVEQEFKSLSALKPGTLVSGTVSALEDIGMLVTLGANVKGLARREEWYGSGRKREGASKYKLGQKVRARVLSVDPARHRVSLTLRPQLVDSKLPALASFEQAQVGARGHAVVTGVTEYGVFVRFYGDLKALAPVRELPLGTGQDPADVYSVGQIVKARVIEADPLTRRVLVSLRAGGTASVAAAVTPVGAVEGDGAPGGAPDPLGGLQPGDVVEGTLRASVNPRSGKERSAGMQNGEAREGPSVSEHSAAHLRDPFYLVDIVAGGVTVTGRLDATQLADHPLAQEAIASQLQHLDPGAPLGQLLVLERLEGSSMVRVTRKPALVAAARQLPADFSQLREGAVVPGYVASVRQDSVFVRFLSQLTGRTGLAQLADQFISSPEVHFRVGQTVRCQVVQLYPAQQRCSLSLKHSLTSKPGRRPRPLSLPGPPFCLPPHGEASPTSGYPAGAPLGLGPHRGTGGGHLCWAHRARPCLRLERARGLHWTCHPRPRSRGLE